MYASEANDSGCWKGGSEVTCLLVGVWIIGTALFAFSVVEFALSALRMISGRRRNRRIWHGPVADPPEPPDKSRYGVHRHAVSRSPPASAPSARITPEERIEHMSTRPIAVVTGASGGVGRATARVFAEAGYDVALLARGIAGLEGAAKEVESEGGRAVVITTDVSSFEEVDAAATLVENELGPIDVWVNDAMTTVFAPTWEIAPDDFRRAVEVTFLGQVWGTMAALARMRPRNRGSIVNVGSALAYMGIPLQSAYCSSKFACRGFFESVRAELLHENSNVRLSMVHLPAVNTPQFDWCETTLDRHPQPVPPIYQPEVAARFILEAALNGRRTKVVGAWNKLLVIAGSLFPGLGNNYAALGAWDTQLTDLPISPRAQGQPPSPGGHGARTTVRTASSTIVPAGSSTQASSAPCLTSPARSGRLLGGRRERRLGGTREVLALKAGDVR